MAERTCSIKGCERRNLARGWCSMHYQRWKTHGNADVPGRRSRQTCKVDDCSTLVVGWGWCEKHYLRWKKTGDPLFATRSMDPEERFRAYTSEGVAPQINPALGPCLLWDGTIDRDGYAKFYVGREQFGHRWSYSHFVEPIPAGLEIDHLCRVRHCVNPRHLEAVTHLENILRGVEARELEGGAWPSTLKPSGLSVSFKS